MSPQNSIPNKAKEPLKMEISDALPLAAPYLVDELVEFEALIVPFFPELIGDHKGAAFEMEWLWTSHAHSSIEIVSSPRANEELIGLEKALNYLIEHDMPYYLNLNTVVRDYEGTDRETIDFFVNFLNEINRSINAPVDVGGRERVAHFVDACRQAITISHEKRNINWSGILAIDSLRTLWWRNTGRRQEAPVYLNTETQFADYLRAGFQFLDAKGDIVSAFRSWRKNMPDFRIRK
ncbi:MAG: hypothetical protein ABJH63_16755 [Rhizobiaceae bacterium]